MKAVGEVISVDTSPTKDAVVDSLTRDISEKACLFDLIDNSIDAATDGIFNKLGVGERDNLPPSYEGYSINLELHGEGYKIEDNCGGIDLEKLKKMVLRFGQRSEHNMGIGIFGVGLNRALFKLSGISFFRTDTGLTRAELMLDVRAYLEQENWFLPANAFESSGKVGTFIEGTEPSPEISLLFGDKNYVDDFRHEVGKRYARFISKGLSIKINGVPAENAEVQIRRDSPFHGEEKFFKTEEGVYVYLRVGQHIDHKFSTERDDDKDKNEVDTSQYGWNIVCNDRAIVFGHTGWETGWEAGFHSEFYGFVGYAEFRHSDPAKLPWNTAKNDIDLNNKVYRLALEEMRDFTKSWRSYCNLVKKTKKKLQAAQSSPAPASAPASVTASIPAAINGQNGSGPIVSSVTQGAIKDDHNQYRTVLPKDVNEHYCHDKHLALVHEGKRLDMHIFPYSGLALIRNLFEASATMYLRRHRIYSKAKEYTIKRKSEAGSSISADEEKKLTLGFDEMLNFFLNNVDYFNPSNVPKLRHSLSQVSKRQGLLNAAVHDVDKQINRSEALQVRDEIVPVLRHLIET